MSLPAGWRAIIDPESGDEYYTNDETGETTWDDPRFVSLDDDAPTDVIASQGKLLLHKLDSVDRSLRTLSKGGDEEAGARGAQDAEEGAAPRPKSTRSRRTSSVSAYAQLPNVHEVPRASFPIDHRMVVPFAEETARREPHVDLNLYRKSKDEWVLLTIDECSTVARLVRTTSRGLTKGAAFELFVGAQSEASAHIVQTTRYLHPVFYVSSAKDGEPMHTVSRKRGANELRLFQGKSESVDDCRYVCMFGDLRAMVKVVDLKALGFHVGLPAADLAPQRFARFASGLDLLLMFCVLSLCEHVSSTSYAMKWEGDVSARSQTAPTPAVAELLS